MPSERETKKLPDKAVPVLSLTVDKHEQETHAAGRAALVDRVGCRAGDESCAAAHASTLSRATSSRPGRAEQSLLQLQREYGNRYVERVLALSREAGNEAQASASNHVETAIEKERGGGQQLDNGVRRQMEGALNADLSGVRVHTDKQADSLNHSLQARAFATGQDIFFSHGAYQPGSSTGRELIAHELTHVVQQGGGQVRRAMTVSQPGDPHEIEAEETARAVMHAEKHGSVHRSALAGAEADAQRQPESHTKEEDEEKKKHHAGVVKANRSAMPGQSKLRR